MFPVPHPRALPFRRAAWLAAALGVLFVPLSAGGAQEATLVSLKDFISAETRHQGFYLPQGGKVHVYAKGGGAGFRHEWSGNSRMFAYGWILESATRKLVWEMGPGNTRPEGLYRVADQYLDLPQGSYEAYYCNYGYARDSVFFRGSIDIDRRTHGASGDGQEARRHSLWRSFFGLGVGGMRKDWQREAGSYGMEIYAASPGALAAVRFQAPLMWKNVVLSLRPGGDGAFLSQGFRCERPMEIHVYALGEGGRREEPFDGGWILDAKTRKRVWEMRPEKAQWAGGAEKNRKTMERVKLPVGEYVACFATDDSHSPAHWNAAPPRDLLNYGLCIALPQDSDVAHFKQVPERAPGRALAQLVRVRDGQACSAPLFLKADARVRVYALGEGTDGRMHDYGWIEEAKTGRRIWTMESPSTHHGGGAFKNRMAEDVIALPKGEYLVQYRTDDSHAFGQWNDDPPRDPEHYGITVYEEKD